MGLALPAVRGAVSGEMSEESHSAGAAALFELLESEVRGRREAGGSGAPQDPALSRDLDRVVAGGSAEFAEEALFNMVTKKEGMSAGRSQVHWKNLSRGEERELGTKVQALMAAGRAREDLKDAAGGIHSDVAAWAEAAGLGHVEGDETRALARKLGSALASTRRSGTLGCSSNGRTCTPACASRTSCESTR